MKLEGLSSLLLVGLLFTGVGCGGMEPRVQAPAAEQGIPGGPAEPEPTTLAEAEARLDQAQADLDRLALNDATPTVPPSAAGAAAPAPAPPAPARSEAASADKAAEAPVAQEPNTCETACKAFSSLTRASDAVCRLDTDSGKRCERAKQIRDNASQRVATCGCGK